MATAYSDLLRIVDAATPRDNKLVAMRGFAEQLQWTPSYEFEASFGVDAAGDHLVVEHGLSNSAIISFLKAPHRASDLDIAQMRALLAISYNNLVEWHIFVSQTDIRQVNNLAAIGSEPNADRIFPLSPSEFVQRLSASEVDHLAESEGFRRTLQSCDDAFIQVLSRWKRLLKADYPSATNSSLSALFNALIFVRGCEDRNMERPHRSDRPLLSIVNASQSTEIDLREVLSAALISAGVNRPLSDYINVAHIDEFTQVDRATALNLIRDFYAPRDAAYDFNFALMSKHALSRIYERYVALLRPEAETEAEQLHFINPTPVEEAPSRTGSVYTPQFIAGFFSRYIRDNTTPRTFRNLRSIDPACGSGIFLRTLLELQCNPTVPGTTAATIRNAFAQTEGIDRDPNACEATRLSLALLHLVATGTLPEHLSIRAADAVVEVSQGRLPSGAYGAVITNPPFIKLDFLPALDREAYRAYLGERYSGRLDAYIPFVKLCLEAVAPDGFVCMVLPQVFLTALNAEQLRKKIASEFDVRCLVDLSSVPVFHGVGAYSILLIVQRRTMATQIPIRAQIARVTEFVGTALQACLDGQLIESPYHSVFTVSQTFFQKRDWVIVSPAHMAIDERLSQMPRLSDYLTVVQGLVSGADDIFILRRSEVPPGEEKVYVSFLPDKEILRYRVPSRTNEVVFYPFEGDRALSADDLADRYPRTWDYLVRNREKLSARGPVRAGNTLWWRPERPREPKVIRGPKIVSPHLMLTPRFALDLKGQFAVSRSPFMVAQDEGEQHAVLKFFCAVLNSSVCNWHLRTYASKYAHGYNRLESNLLKAVPVPDMRSLSASDLSRVMKLVDKLTGSKGGLPELDAELDSLVSEFYGFTVSERKTILGLD